MSLKAATLVALGFLAFAGSARGHLPPAGEVHIDFTFDPPYVSAGEFGFQIWVSNPTPSPVRFEWGSGCTVWGSIVSEERIIWQALPGPPPDVACTAVMIDIDVAPMTSILFAQWPITLTSDDGCISIRMGLNRYPVDGAATLCPQQDSTVAAPIELSIEAPGRLESGRAFAIQTTARTPDGAPVPGVRVTGLLRGEEIGSKVTDPHGQARFLAQAPLVSEEEVATVFIVASGEGWQTTAARAVVPLFPLTTASPDATPANVESPWRALPLAVALVISASAAGLVLAWRRENWRQ